MNIDVNYPDISLLKYKWTVPIGAGSLSNNEIANPVYTAPDVNETQIFTLTIEVSDSNNSAQADIDITVIANIAPVINLVSASPNFIFDSQSSQLLVSAFDEDNGPSPLTYNWIVPPGSGSVSSPAIANPVYIPPNVNGVQTFTLIANVSDGKDTVDQLVDISVVANTAPVITSLTARPNAILDTQTCQLFVSAIDTDNGPSPLSYEWVVPAGCGYVSNPAAPDPIYVPPNVSANTTYRLTVYISDGDDTTNAAIDITVNDAYIFFESFESGTGNFIYVNNAFRQTLVAGYSSGERLRRGGYNGGCLQVNLGGTNTTSVVKMSGGWRRTFYLPASANIDLAFRYNMTMSNYESDEYSDVIAEIDGFPIRTGRLNPIGRIYGIFVGGNDYIARLYGGQAQISTGWQSFTKTLNLPAGNHTITIGGYNSQKTDDREITTIKFDNVSLQRNQ